MKTSGLVFVFILLAADSVLLFVSQDYHPLAKKLPQLVGGLIWILLAWELLLGLWKKKHETIEDKAGIRDTPSPFVIKRWITLAICLLGYVIFLPKLGFLMMTSLLLLSMLWCFKVRQPLTLILYTGIIVGGIYGVFAKLLYVPLPTGIWW